MHCVVLLVFLIRRLCAVRKLFPDLFWPMNKYTQYLHRANKGSLVAKLCKKSIIDWNYYFTAAWNKMRLKRNLEWMLLVITCDVILQNQKQELQHTLRTLKFSSRVWFLIHKYNEFVIILKYSWYSRWVWYRSTICKQQSITQTKRPYLDLVGDENISVRYHKIVCRAATTSVTG